MIKNKIKFLLGLIFAPAFILFVLPLFNCLYPIFKREIGCMQSIASFAFYGLPVAIVAIVISLPLVYLFVKKRWVGFFHFGLGGVLVSLILSAIMLYFGFGTNVTGVLFVMVSMGLSSALIFWFVAIKDNILSNS